MLRTTHLIVAALLPIIASSCCVHSDDRHVVADLGFDLVDKRSESASTPFCIVRCTVSKRSEATHGLAHSVWTHPGGSPV